MTPAEVAPQFALIMKAGPHAGESLSTILARKLDEVATAGFTLWGYGGTLCHPITQIRPLMEQAAAAQQKVHVLFVPTGSDPGVAPTRATEYSPDGESWSLLPDKPPVTGSKYALVLGSLEKSTTELPLMSYEIAVGPSAGTPAREYIRGRVDKACIRYVHDGSDGTRLPIIATGALKPPFAVFVR